MSTRPSELEKYFNTKISVTLLWKYPNYKAMLGYFAQRFDESKAEERRHSEEDLTEILRSLEDLSPDRLKEILDSASL